MPSIIDRTDIILRFCAKKKERCYMCKPLRRLITPHLPAFVFVVLALTSPVPLGFFSLISLSLIPLSFGLGLASSSSPSNTSSSSYVSLHQYERSMGIRDTYIKHFFYVWSIHRRDLSWRNSKVCAFMESYWMIA
jgi:hypothetical protein